MQVSFTLRKDKINKDGLIPVRMLITIDEDRIRRNVKNVKTKLKDWKNQRLKPNLKTESYNFHIEYNKQLDELENKVKLIFRYMLLNNIPLSIEYVIEKLDSENFGINNIAPNFFDSFQEFIDSNRAIKTLSTSKRYISALNFIKDFENTINYQLRFDTINVDFYEKFRDYAFEVESPVKLSHSFRMKLSSVNQVLKSIQFVC